MPRSAKMLRIAVRRAAEITLPLRSGAPQASWLLAPARIPRLAALQGVHGPLDMCRPLTLALSGSMPGLDLQRRRRA